MATAPQLQLHWGYNSTSVKIPWELQLEDNYNFSIVTTLWDLQLHKSYNYTTVTTSWQLILSTVYYHSRPNWLSLLLWLYCCSQIIGIFHVELIGTETVSTIDFKKKFNSHFIPIFFCHSHMKINFTLCHINHCHIQSNGELFYLQINANRHWNQMLVFMNNALYGVFSCFLVWTFFGWKR